VAGERFDPARLAGSRVVVVSPHLDDAVLSLGSTIARLTAAGADVRAVTVFAGDPESEAPADEWGRRCGFATRGEEARGRREEDRRACAVVSASPEWLAFEPDAVDDDVRRALADALRGAELVLTPGWPCSHPDHVRASRLVLDLRAGEPLGLYVDQPYAMWRVLGAGTQLGAGRRGNFRGLALRRAAARKLIEPGVGAELALRRPPTWEAVPRSVRDWLRKQRALRCYRSQLAGFGPVMPVGVAVYERAAGGELVGLA
jgi:LmbE family N-acetylglucosaminyl deacetylase